MIAISDLPHLNAALNATSLVLLTTGWLFIRRKKVKAHRACMISAFAVAILFLVSYVVYHAHAGSTRFTGTGIVRPVYFFILSTHVVLAATIVPLAIVTMRRAFRNEIDRHRALARFTLPLWLYVSVTGLIVYTLLYHVYRAA